MQEYPLLPMPPALPGDPDRPRDYPPPGRNPGLTRQGQGGGPKFDRLRGIVDPNGAGLSIRDAPLNIALERASVTRARATASAAVRPTTRRALTARARSANLARCRRGAWCVLTDCGRRITPLCAWIRTTVDDVADGTEHWRRDATSGISRGNRRWRWHDDSRS